MSSTNFSVSVPCYLIEQVDRRATAFGRSRNGEWRYLLGMGLEYADEGVVGPTMPPSRGSVPWRQVTVRVPEDLLFEVRGLSDTGGRRVGPQLLYLVLLAMAETATRDLIIIQQMITQQGSVARCS